MLTGEFRFHLSTSLGIEPGSLMMGSKQVDHWTSQTVYKCIEITSSPQGSPQQSTMLVVKLEGYSEREIRTEELCEIKWDFHIVSMTA
jgi:hypothetical protein